MGLRGHHLICLRFFRGEGYDRAFIENLSAIIAKAESGTPVSVLEGPDDVCRACLHLKDDGCGYEADAESAIRAMDADALRLLDIRLGDSIRWSSIGEKIAGVLPRWKQLHCKDCSWLDACRKDPLYKTIDRNR